MKSHLDSLFLFFFPSTSSPCPLSPCPSSRRRRSLAVFVFWPGRRVRIAGCATRQRRSDELFWSDRLLRESNSSTALEVKLPVNGYRISQPDRLPPPAPSLSTRACLLSRGSLMGGGKRGGEGRMYGIGLPSQATSPFFSCREAAGGQMNYPCGWSDLLPSSPSPLPADFPQPRCPRSSSNDRYSAVH